MRVKEVLRDAYLNINIHREIALSLSVIAAFLKKPLEDYVAELPVPVVVLRSKKRTGLVRARLLGAEKAVGKF